MTRNGTLTVMKWQKMVRGVGFVRKYKLTTTGDHLTLIAAAEVFNARIVIVSSIPGDNFVVEINPIKSHVASEDGTVKIVPAMHLLTLSHFAEFHYGSVHSIDPENSPFQSHV